jgi:transposase InsO family protein
MIKEGERIHPTVSLGHCMLDNEGAVRYRGALWVPESIQMRVVEALHKAPDSGHPGIVRTVRLIKSRYYWPRLDRTVKTFITYCHECRRANAPRDTYHGVLNPLPIPDRPWSDISIDFVTRLPMSNGYNTILMVVYRLTKMCHLIPCVSDGEGGTSTEKTVELILKHVWKLHGLPSSIVSDRGPQFVADMWQHLCQLLKIQAKLSTAHHPQTDGQSEISNLEMERYLRTYTGYM